MERNITITTTSEIHTSFVAEICEQIELAAIARGTGIAKRDPKQIEAKIIKGDAVIALEGNQLVGFCYLQQWSNGAFVSHSSLIVTPTYRKAGIAMLLKKALMQLTRSKYPDAKVFGITTNMHVMKINTELGYIPTGFSEITQDDAFWQQCQSCPNFDVLQRANRKMCYCTAMLAPSTTMLAARL